MSYHDALWSYLLSESLLDNEYRNVVGDYPLKWCDDFVTEATSLANTRRLDAAS